MKAYVACLLLNISPSPAIVLIVFLVTYSVYSINKLDDKEEDATNVPERGRFIIGRETLLLRLAIGAYLLAVAIGFQYNIQAAAITLIPITSGLLYSSNIFKRFGLPRLKDITAVKNILVALSWGATVSLLPTTISNAPLILSILLLPFFIGKSLVNTVIFDTRDIEGDRAAGVKTIPVVLGIRHTRSILLFVNTVLLVWLWNWAQIHGPGIPLVIGSASVAYGYFTVFLYCSSRARHSSLDLVVDGEWAMLTALALILSVLST